MPGAAEDVAHFVTHEFFDIRAGGTEIFSGIKFFRIVRKSLANSSSHREAEVGINVYFGASNPARDLDVSFRNAGGLCAHSATVLIDIFNQVFGHTGSAVQNERVVPEPSIQQGFLNCLEPFEIEMLLAFEFVCAV